LTETERERVVGAPASGYTWTADEALTTLAPQPFGPGVAPPMPPDLAARVGWLRPARYVGMPIFLSLVCLALYLWVRSKELDSIEERSLNREFLTDKIIEHINLAAVSTVAVILIAVPLGILVTRPIARFLTPVVLGIANIGQAVPSIGLLVLFVLWFDQVGFRPAVYALVAYSALPILRNTMVGLQQVDRSTIEAGRGMGMTKLGALLRIELPLAVPIILAGIRTALILNVGVAVLGTFINAGTLGDLITTGLALDRDPVLITGAVLTGVLALAIDWLAGIAEDVLRPRGL
jgi:osmoprotectant transport system permease protein